MNLQAILELLKQLLGGFDQIGDASKWSVLSVQYDGKSVPGTVTALVASPVEINATVSFKGEDGADVEINVAAKHHSTSKAKVLVNGELDADAALIFAFKGSIGNPTRWAFDFKNVTVEGEDYRINLRFDPS